MRVVGLFWRLDDEFWRTGNERMLRLSTGNKQRGLVSHEPADVTAPSKNLKLDYAPADILDTQTGTFTTARRRQGVSGRRTGRGASGQRVSL